MDAFFWLGDVVYVQDRNGGVQAMKEELHKFKTEKEYLTFRKDIRERKGIVDGIWDDHDYGVRGREGRGRKKGDEETDPTFIVGQRCRYADGGSDSVAKGL